VIEKLDFWGKVGKKEGRERGARIANLYPLYSYRKRIEFLFAKNNTELNKHCIAVLIMFMNVFLCPLSSLPLPDKFYFRVYRSK